ncbi:unnamed protein product [Haemonchus placei]|uniref:Transposase n=1 Tax=Haemonchus placei TaxID=6290 RepID=A0A0N4X746_HAEPC|nr:unnamed protein product [Haemonchus placei]
MGAGIDTGFREINESKLVCSGIVELTRLNDSRGAVRCCSCL